MKRHDLQVDTNQEEDQSLDNLYFEQGFYSDSEEKVIERQRDINKREISLHKNENDFVDTLSLEVISNILAFGFENSGCNGKAGDIFRTLLPDLKGLKTENGYPLAEVFEIIWRKKNDLFSNGNQHLSELIKKCNLHGKRLEDIAAWFSKQYDLIEAKGDRTTPPIQRQIHIAGLKKELDEIEARLSEVIDSYPETINDTSEDDIKQSESQEINNTHYIDKQKFKNSHVLIAATLIYLGLPAKAKYNELKEALVNADKKYGLDIYNDSDDSQLWYNPVRRSDNEAEIFKFSNLNKAVASIRKEFQSYINKIDELATNGKEFSEDLKKTNTP